jgi:lipoprotein-releasing system ATP-binding protein
MNSPILELHSIAKTFDSEGEHLVVFENIDLAIAGASKTAITGESGCGKSTLLNIIGGLESPTAGSVRAGPFLVNELDEAGLSAYRSKYLGLVFQFHYLLKDFTALENVMLPAFMAGMKKKDAIARAKALIADVGLEARMSHYPAQMSGGERQRAAVARALINEPSLVLADEPTGNLDPANAETVREMLFSVVTRYGKTLIIVTHDRETAALADECYCLQNSSLTKVYR